MRDYTIYVTEEIAKKVMEKGFEFSIQVSFREFFNGHEYFIQKPSPRLSKDDVYFLIPTAEQICGWLREEKKLQVDVSYRSRYEDANGKADFADWYYVVRGINLYQIIEDTEFSSYEEALLEGINKALDLI